MNIGDIVGIIEDFCRVEKVNVGDFNGLVSSSDKEIMEESCKKVTKLEEEFTIPKYRKKTVEKKQKTEAKNIDYNNKTSKVRNKEDKER